MIQSTTIAKIRLWAVFGRCPPPPSKVADVKTLPHFPGFFSIFPDFFQIQAISQLLGRKIPILVRISLRFARAREKLGKKPGILDCGSGEKAGFVASIMTGAFQTNYSRQWFRNTKYLFLNGLKKEIPPALACTQNANCHPEKVSPPPPPHEFLPTKSNPLKWGQGWLKPSANHSINIFQMSWFPVQIDGRRNSSGLTEVVLITKWRRWWSSTFTEAMFTSNHHSAISGRYVQMGKEFNSRFRRQFLYLFDSFSCDS